MSGSVVPRWRSLQQWTRSSLPAALRPWLCDYPSLTQQLRACCGPAFRVVLLAEGWRRPPAWERSALAMAQRERAWLREVYLCCGAQRWVYARTVIPAGTLHGELQQLTRLGTRPLGEFIFADPTLERGDVQLGTVQDATSFAGPTDSVASLQGRLWGRRAVFRLQGKPLLVTEFFLPDMVSTLESGK